MLRQGVCLASVIIGAESVIHNPYLTPTPDSVFLTHLLSEYLGTQVGNKEHLWANPGLTLG